MPTCNRLMRRTAVVALAVGVVAAPSVAVATEGDISTVAGTGISGFLDGSTATAQMGNPYAVAVTPDGGFLFADPTNNRIRKVLNGSISTVAGTGAYGFSGDGAAATNAKLASPRGVAVTPDGGFLIADTFNARIRKVMNGVITTVAGTTGSGFSGDGGPATSAQLDYPNSVAMTADGGFLIADEQNHRVRKVFNGVIATVAGTGTAAFSDGSTATAKLNYPSDIAVLPDGGFLIADAGNSRIRKVSNGTVTTVAGTGIAGDSGDGSPATAAKIFTPASVALTADGGFLIVDATSNRIRKVLNGTITTVAGNGTAAFSGDGGPAEQASLKSPEAVGVTPDGGFLIADTGNSRIRKVEGPPPPTPGPSPSPTQTAQPPTGQRAAALTRCKKKHGIKKKKCKKRARLLPI